MDLQHLITFNLTLLVAIASPGPALLMAIRTNLSAGRSSGLALGFGLGIMAATWTLMAFLGLDWIFRTFPWLYMAVKTIGAAYLIYVAVRMWLGAKTPIDVTAEHKVHHAFWSGILVNLLNPKAVLFAAAVLIVIFPTKLSLAEGAVLVTNHMVFEWVFYTVLAFALSTKAVSNRYLRAKVYIDRFAALVLGGLGARLLLTR